MCRQKYSDWIRISLVVGPGIQVHCQPRRGNTHYSMVFVHGTNTCKCPHKNTIATNGSHSLLGKLPDVTVCNDSGTSHVYESSASLRPSNLLRRLAEEWGLIGTAPSFHVRLGIAYQWDAHVTEWRPSVNAGRSPSCKVQTAFRRVAGLDNVLPQGASFRRSTGSVFLLKLRALDLCSPAAEETVSCSGLLK